MNVCFHVFDGYLSKWMVTKDVNIDSNICKASFTLSFILAHVGSILLSALLVLPFLLLQKKNYLSLKNLTFFQ